MSITKVKFEELLYKEVGFYEVTGRAENSNFLLWFLVNYYRLDEDEAVDYICDTTNDKGIDGIFLDTNTEEIFLFQSKFRQDFSNGQGDVDLRNFIGAREWFTPENVGALDDSRASRELKDLVRRLEVFERIVEGYKLNLVFITTGYFNRSAKDYIRITENSVEYWDCNSLYDNYTYIGSDNYVMAEYIFNIDEDIIDYSGGENFPTYIFSVKASDIIELEGIIDKTLFAKNVRYGLGRTRVNKDIKETIENENEHKKFLLYNNGITLIAKDLSYNENRKELRVKNYSIVNGCQTTLALYENRNHISDDLKLILKVIKTGDNPQLGRKITYYTNNQNPISIVDLWSQDKFQQDLQENFKETFNDTVFYKIKPGEDTEGYDEIIPNTFAAQLIYSFILEKPYEAHLKTKIFSTYHNDIFDRNTNEYLIYFLYKIYNLIEDNISNIDNTTIRSYKLTRFFFLNLIKKVMKEDRLGNTFFYSPKNFYNNYKDRIKNSFTKLIKILMIEFNAVIEDASDDNTGYVDYKNLLRNSEEVIHLLREIFRIYKRSLVRHPEEAVGALLSEEIAVVELKVDRGAVEEKTTIKKNTDITYWITPVKDDNVQTAVECIKELVGEERIYAFSSSTPNRKRFKPGDKICFYATTKGVVADAVIVSKPDDRIKNQKVRNSEKYPWIVKLDKPRLYLNDPIVINPKLRAILDAFKDKDFNKNWAWFVQATRKITENDFIILTQNN